jgi:hypothetical protein
LAGWSGWSLCGASADFPFFNVEKSRCPRLFSFSPQEELCDLPARVLKQGLDVLGIETVKQM